MAAYGNKNKVKQEIIGILKTNMDLLKFVHYVDETKKDICKMPDLNSEQIRYIVDNCIYRNQKINAVKDIDKKCYISMNYGLKQYHEMSNPYFSGNAFSLYVMCDRDIDYIESNGSRIDAIEQCIVDIFDGADIGSIGNCYVDISEPIQNKTNDYIGTHISLIFKDKKDNFNGKQKY